MTEKYWPPPVGALSVLATSVDLGRGVRHPGQGGCARPARGEVHLRVPPPTEYRLAVPLTLQAPPMSAVPHPFATVRAKSSWA